jgi:DNA-binding transcriptional ArsR family regulator
VDAGVDRVFAALADPSRRFVLERLASRGSASQTELADELPVTRQAVAKHLATLLGAGLVRAERRGRETRYELESGPLGDATEWLERVGAEWDARLAALARHVEPRAPEPGQRRLRKTTARRA